MTTILPPIVPILGFSLDARRPLFPNTRGHEDIDKVYLPMEQESQNKQSGNYHNVSQPHTNFSNQRGVRRMDGVVITNIDKLGYNKGIESIVLPFIPQEISVSPETTYVSIKPIGRNTYNYHFIGSEDLIEFEIDWFSMGGQKDYVINQCRKVEALSKPDGYDREPPRVRILWGAQSILFQDRTFQVLKAPYKLSNFKVGYYDSNKNFVNTNMLPHQATQTITLARVANASLTHAMILK